jgi:hypothetical protein
LSRVGADVEVRAQIALNLLENYMRAVAHIDLLADLLKRQKASE